MHNQLKIFEKAEFGSVRVMNRGLWPRMYATLLAMSGKV